jgi:DNA polymerase III gamma/tau subunit
MNMNDIPPKHTPDATSGNLVAMYQASGSNAESFPVLKAFQEYIDAERAQARKRVMMLSISFSIVLCAVVLVFLGMGIYMLKDMSALQSKLVDAALSQRTVPAPVITVTAPQPAPAPVVQAQPVAPVASPVSEELREVSKALADLKADIEKKKNQEAQEVALVAQKKAADQAVELQKLQNEMGSIKKENQMLKESFVTQRKVTQQQKSAPGTRPAGTVAKNEPVKTPETEKKVEPEPAPAVAASTEKTGIAPTPPVMDEARYPAATKEPPVTPDGVKGQDPQKGMMATSIPLKTKNMGTVTWRVVIPD